MYFAVENTVLRSRISSVLLESDVALFQSVPYQVGNFFYFHLFHDVSSVVFGGAAADEQEIANFFA